MSKLLVASLAAPLLFLATRARADQQPYRTFLFNYAGSVTGLNPGQEAQVWIPVARTDRDQLVRVVGRTVPGLVESTCDDENVNSFLYCRARARPDGTIGSAVTYRITRYEVVEQELASRADDSRFLKPDGLVPVGGKPARVLPVGRNFPVDSLQKARFYTTSSTTG